MEPNKPKPAAINDTSPSEPTSSPAVISGTDEKNLGWKAHDFNTSVTGQPLPSKTKMWFQDRRVIAGIGLLLVVAIAAGSVLFIKKPIRTAAAKDTSLDLQGLSNNLLNGLNNVAGGSNQQQTLNIAAGTNFKNTATVDKKFTTKDTFEARSTIEANGDINAFKDLNVAGAANFNTLNLRSNFSIAGTSTIQGNIDAKGQLSVGGPLNVNGAFAAKEGASIGGNLSVTGGISAGGPISGTKLTVTDLSFNGTLTLAGHIASAGATPGATTDVGAGGTGSSVRVSGNDTAGTVVITTGNRPAIGVLARVDFKKSFTTVPKVLLTPVGGQSAKIEYYVGKSSNFFTIETNTTAQAGKQYAYDYFVIE